ncbi:MAG: 2-dehydropantoate 2-reductase [Elusimicrobia bacterium]|nr:2-dehydropantoate 2-reductase [Elusimicrobiota bacterium]
MSPATPRIVIVGPGAIGGLLAARFIRSGFPVKLLVKNSQRASFLRRKGLRIEENNAQKIKTHFISSKRFERIEPKASHLSGCDLIFFCTKSYDTLKAARSARPLVDEAQAIVSLQNGIIHKPILNRIFGTKKLVLGISFIAATRSTPNHIRHISGDLIYLAAHPTNKKVIPLAREALEHCGWRVRVTSDEKGMLWTKLMLNASTNPLAALSGVSNEHLVRNPALKDLLLKTLQESLGVMHKTKIRPLFPDLRQIVLKAMDHSEGQINSMLQDIQAGRPTEIDAIVLPILKEARQQGQKLPFLEGLYRFVKGLEKDLHE